MSEAETAEASSSSESSAKAFDEVLRSARFIKEKYVDPRVDWYKTHSSWPRWLFRGAGVVTVLLSVILPPLSVPSAFPHRELVLSAASIVVAALTGIGSFYRWDKTWHGNTSAHVALEQHIAKWELELTNARLLLPADERVRHVYLATSTLLASVQSVVMSESEGFFSALQFPQQSTSQKT